jgi:hypothetical protein
VGHPGPRIEARHARQPAVHHHAHALDGEARLGDARRQHDLATPRRRRIERGVLIALRQVAEQRMHAHRARQRAVVEHRAHAADLGRPGEEDQQIAGMRRQRRAHRGDDCGLDAAAARTRLGAPLAPVHGHRMAAPGAGHDRRRLAVGLAEQRRDACAVERRRHDQDAQLVAQQLLRLQREREPQVGVQAALVVLVEEHGAERLQCRIVLQHPRQHALGHDLHARAGPDARLVADAVADRLADLLAERRGEPSRRGAGSQPSGLEHEDAAPLQPGRVEQRQRHARRLPRSGRRLQHGARARLQRLTQGRERLVDRERRETGRQRHGGGASARHGEPTGRHARRAPAKVSGRPSRGSERKQRIYAGAARTAQRRALRWPSPRCRQASAPCCAERSSVRARRRAAPAAAP